MGHTWRSWNTATPETLAERGRAMRPTLPAPDGEHTWYHITNNIDEATNTPIAAVHIYGDIGSWGITAASFVEELKAVDAAEITLYINSPGGEVFDGLAIHNALRSHRARVMVQVDSLAASIASVIAMAGDRIVMSPHSQMMIHDAQGVSCGSPEELREYADFLDRQSDNIAAVYAERAGGTKAQWRKRMQAESWYFADEAVAAGLADEVAKPQRMTPDEEEQARAAAAAWDLSVYNYAHTSREEAPTPALPAADGGVVTGIPPIGEGPACDGLIPSAAFDPAVFRAAATAALDPMPGYQPDHLRSLMAGVAGDAPTAPEPHRPAAPYVPPPVDTVPEPDPQDVAADHFRSHMASVANNAPAAPEPVRPAAPYVPRPVDQAPEQDPQEVAVGWWRSVFAGVANNAPAAPPSAAPAPVAEAPQTVYVPEPPPPAGQVTADYMRAIVTDVANNAPAPPQPAAPEPVAPAPIPSIDRTAIDRALWEARL